MPRLHRLLPGALALALVASPATELSGQGVRFTLAPSAEYIWWDEALPIKDYTLLGARAGADFGRLIGLTAWYHRGTDIPVSLSETSLRNSGAPFANTTTDVETYGANLEFKLGAGRIVPFVHGGAGVIRFQPAAAPAVEQVNYRYGGGIQYDVARNIRATVLLEDSRFRLAPEALSSEVPDARSENPSATRRNWTASAALGFALGGSRYGPTAGADNWSFASIPIEPFVGRLEFDDDHLRRQTVAGVRAGVDFGNYVGLRGVYWQGRSDGLADRQPIQGYGAEAQFNLNAGLGLAPFLVAGVQRIDYQEDYRDARDMMREDENALVVGGGVGVRLTDNFRLNVAARDYIRSSRDFDDIASVDNLTHNWMLSAGLAFNLGRSRDRADEDSREEGRERMKARERDDERMKARERDEDRMRRGEATETGRGRVIMLPVPESGELYVRYGESSTSLIERLSRGDSLLGRQTATLSDADIDRIVRRLSDHIERILEQRLERMQMPAAGQRTRVPPAREERTQVPPARQERTPEMPPRYEDTPGDTGRVFDGVAAYVAVGDALALGVQLDAGPLFGMESLRLVPEFAIALAGDKSVLFAAGAEYRFGMLQVSESVRLRPHARLSLGLLAASGDTDSQFGLNFAYGVTFAPRDGTPVDRKPRLFVEHQGISFFDQNRLAGGLRWTF
ncbi:MAG TPA: outer membrane beta-barrel protein [Gemmatimonadales bacterium]|nr:outer membrane beta-barrel protein [Gemmatimonadales bacterium]